MIGPEQVAEAIRLVSRSYRSGWCSTGSHERCAGRYAGTPCTCRCHLAATLFRMAKPTAAPAGGSTSQPPAGGSKAAQVVAFGRTPAARGSLAAQRVAEVARRLRRR